MKKTSVTIMGSFVALLLICSGAAADTYSEVGDAGQTQGTAQSSGLTQAGMIFGSISSVNDADVFSLTVSNTSTISFTTVNSLTGTSGGPGGLDTELFLFTSAGLPVFANDDRDGLTVQSALPSGNSFLTTLSAGAYYVAISLSGNDPVNLVNQLVFASSANPNAIRGPASGTSPQNWNTFDSGAFSGPTGAYEIDILAVPEPSVLALYAVGLVFLLLLARKRSLASRFRRRAAQAIVIVALLTLAGVAQAKQDVPSNLGNGLDRLVRSNVEIKNAAGKGLKSATVLGNNGKRYTTEENAAIGNLAITDAKTGRIMVRINLDGSLKPADAKVALKAAIGSLEITALDAAYRGVGVMNARISIDDVPALAQSAGVRSVVLELKPRHAKRGPWRWRRPGAELPEPRHLLRPGRSAAQGR